MSMTFDYTDGGYAIRVSDDLYQRTDGGMMYDMGGGMAMDMESGSMHILDDDRRDNDYRLDRDNDF